jgi:hypothetical protein
MIADYVGSDPGRFAVLMKYMLGSVYRLSQRSAWPVSYCIQRYPELAKPYFNILIQQLERADAHVAVRRNVARLLQFVDIPKRYHGRVFDACYNLFADPSEPVAVRVFAMTVAAKVARDEPDLLDELRLVATKHPEAATAGFRSRARRVLGVWAGRMKMVMVIGSGDSGKSTFSRRLGEKLDIEVIPLDNSFGAKLGPNAKGPMGRDRPIVMLRSTAEIESFLDNIG